MRRTEHTVGLVSLAVLTIGCLSLTAQQSQHRSPATSRMSGTYELESTRGDDPQRAAKTATQSLPPASATARIRAFSAGSTRRKRSRSIATDAP